MTYTQPINRREFVKSIGSGAAVGSLLVSNCSSSKSTEKASQNSQLKTSINHFTIRQSDMLEAARLANAAGFEGFEPLYRSFQQYVNENSEDAVVEFFDSLSIHPFHVHGFPSRYMHLSRDEFTAAAESYP